MGAVGLEEMDKSEISQFCLEVHGVKLRRKSQLASMIIKVQALDDTLENPLELGEEVRYKNEAGICTISKVGKTFEIMDADDGVFDEIDRVDLTRVTPKLKPSTSEEKLSVDKTDSDPEVQTVGKATEAKVEAKVDSTPEENRNYPHKINDSSYRPKPGGIVIGGLPDDGSSNTRKTGVTHVLDDKVETVKPD